MTPVTCFAHAALVVDIEVDDETGEVAVAQMNSAYEVGRALNPKLVEQQLVGGAWMGMSHALWETTEPYYPDRSHGPVDFNDYLMPGPGDIAPHNISILERPAPDGPFGGKGPGEMCANPVLPAVANAVFNAVGVRITDLPITPEKVLRGIQGEWRRARRRSARRASHLRREGATALPVRRSIVGIDSPEALERALGSAQYLADEGLATAAYLALALGKPLLLEGAPGVGKTEAAKAISAVLGRALIRLQCYEGIDAAAALYEWNYPRQMLAIRQAGEQSINIYGDEFLIARPMLEALRQPDTSTLLIDEIDRSDHEFEAFLLEFLSDFQISIPERGTVRAMDRPVVVLTSNRTRELHEALRRRCVYHWIGYPDAGREAQIVMMRASSVARSHRRGGRGRGGPPAAGAFVEAAGGGRNGGMGRGRDVAQPGRRHLAGGVPARHRGRDQGSGRSRLPRRPARRRDHGGCGVSDALPRALAPFVRFAGLLRANGFAVAPEQTQAFIAAVGLLGPRSMADVHRAAVPTLAPPPERRDEFDALFRLLFHGQTLAAPADADPEDDEDLQVLDAQDGATEPPEADDEEEVGGEATAMERLMLRRFDDEDPRATLQRFARDAPGALPRQRSFRRRAGKTGDRWNMSRLLRDAVRRDGEVLSLPKLARKTRQRRILLLIDVSGSMKAQTDDAMSLAHSLTRAAERAEVFTLGTRLTRVTRALRLRHRGQALGATVSLVTDWDGGTRLGDALDAFLHVPRFAAFTRGALVVIVSDGLERGDPAVLVAALRKMATLAWRIAWLTPLAADAGYTPQTAALRAVLPSLDHLGNGAGLRPLCDEILSLTQRFERPSRRHAAPTARSA